MSMLKQISVKLEDEEYHALCDICQPDATISGMVRMLIMATANGCLMIPSDKHDDFEKIYNKYLGGKHE